MNLIEAFFSLEDLKDFYHNTQFSPFVCCNLNNFFLNGKKRDFLFPLELNINFFCWVYFFLSQHPRGWFSYFFLLLSSFNLLISFYEGVSLAFYCQFLFCLIKVKIIRFIVDYSYNFVAFWIFKTCLNGKFN